MVIWTGVGLAGLAVLCAVTGVVITPLANRAPADDAPIVVADLMLFACAALAMVACVAVFAGLLLGSALSALWHRWRPGRSEQPEAPWPPRGGPAAPAGGSGPGAPPDREQPPPRTR